MPLSALILDALFPDACLGCLAPRDGTFRHEVACEACIRSINLPTMFRCVTCEKRTSQLAPACHPASPSMLTLASAGERVPGHLASALLYENIYRAVDPLGELTAAAAVSCGTPLHRAYAAPLPEVPALIRERGYAANTLLTNAFAATLGIPSAENALTAMRTGGKPLYGIGTPGDAASANLLILVSVEEVPRSVALQLARLARAACPHAEILFIACIT